MSRHGFNAPNESPDHSLNNFTLWIKIVAIKYSLKVPLTWSKFYRGIELLEITLYSSSTGLISENHFDKIK